MRIISVVPCMDKGKRFDYRLCTRILSATSGLLSVFDDSSGLRVGSEPL